MIMMGFCRNCIIKCYFSCGVTSQRHVPRNHSQFLDHPCLASVYLPKQASLSKLSKGKADVSVCFTSDDYIDADVINTSIYLLFDKFRRCLVDTVYA